MIRLFLENHEVELNEAVSFAITKQFEDVASPATIKNDWSKTVRIPFTQVNNKIFGMLFNPDRLIVEGDSSLMGVYFNPYKKVNFRLQWGDTIVMQGYAKNISVNREADNKGTYNITLNGELGKVFQEMKKITFDTTTEDTKYLIDGSDWIEETINKELVHKLWSTEANSTIDLQPKYNKRINPNTGQIHKSPNLAYKVEDILGFAPNNSFNSGFDYKTFQYDNYSSKKFSDELNQKAENTYKATYEEVTGIAADTIIGEGLLPREIGEYRSYMQLPYIYFNKLFQIFMKKTKEITGYDTELDSGWFNIDNPYWGQLVYMLKQLNTEDDNGSTKEIDLITDLLGRWIYDGDGTGENAYTPVISTPIVKDIATIKYDTAKPSKINDILSMRLSLKNPLDENDKAITLTDTDRYVFGRGNRISVVLQLVDRDGNVLDTCKNMFISQDWNGGSLNLDKTWFLHKIPSSVLAKNGYIDLNGVMQFFNYPTTTQDLTIRANVSFNSAVKYFFYLNNIDTYQKNRIVFSTMELNVFNSPFLNEGVPTAKRSGATFTLNDLWDNEYNIFNEILNYCKAYRIGVFCDDINKKLIFKPFSTYFSEYTIEDWSDKLDTSREYHIQPITFENKYLLFNYKGVLTYLNNQFKEETGLNYGEYRLTTDYEFNNETKNLYDGLNNSLVNTDNVLSWVNLYDKLQASYVFPAEISIYNKDKDNKNMSVFGSMYFYNGLTNFDSSDNMRGVQISDDTRLQIATNTYFYTQISGENLKITTYPLLDVIYKKTKNVCLFATPAKNYTYVLDNYTNCDGNYHNFWENYLNERYSKQNKIVTCYLKLTQQDFANFRYNNFIRIENQLYMVNKIYDYQLNENISTKVDLITIQDIKGYTDCNYNPIYIYRLVNNEYVPFDSETEVITLPPHTNKNLYITSNKTIHWETDNRIQNDLEINQEDGEGEIPAGEKVAVDFYNDEFMPSDGYVTFTNGYTTIKIRVIIE